MRKKIFKKIYEIDKYKDILFDILLDYNNDFGKEITFDNVDIYRDFVKCFIYKGKYLLSLNYLDIILYN